MDDEENVELARGARTLGVAAGRDKETAPQPARRRSLGAWNGQAARAPAAAAPAAPPPSDGPAARLLAACARVGAEAADDDRSLLSMARGAAEAARGVLEAADDVVGTGSRGGDATTLAVVPGTATAWASDYLRGGTDLRQFQVDALSALRRGRDVLVAVPCGAGKSLAGAVYAAESAAAVGTDEQRICVWLVPTTALAAEKAADLDERFAASWTGRGGRFALEVARSRVPAADVVFHDDGDAEMADAAPAEARHAVLASIDAREKSPAVLVMTPEMYAAVSGWMLKAMRAGWVSCVVIDEADQEAGVVGSYRPLQAKQGQTVAAARRVAASVSPASFPVMALSGTVAAYDVAPLLGALGLAREGSSGSESSPAASGGETLVIRTAATITNVEHVRDLELADGRAAPDVRDACLSIIGDTPRSDPVLLYCLRPKSVKKLAAFLTSALAATGSDRQVVYLCGGDDVTAEEKREVNATFRSPGAGVVAVMNPAGSRGLDNALLKVVVVVDLPTSLQECLQLFGRAARDPSQRGYIHHLWRRGDLLHTASVVRDDAAKLAALADVAALTHAVSRCWRATSDHLMGDALCAGAAQPTLGCCPACTRAFYAEEGDFAAYATRPVPEVDALVACVAGADAARRGQATFRALTRGAFVSDWDPARTYTVRGRGRVVFDLLVRGVLVFAPARGPAESRCVKFAVNRRAASGLRRTGVPRVDFLPSDLT